MDAVERAPKAFPVVDAPTLAEAREWKLERSDFALRRRELQALSQAYGQLHELVQLDLKDLGLTQTKERE